MPESCFLAIDTLLRLARRECVRRALQMIFSYQEVFATSECGLWHRLKVARTSKQCRQLRCGDPLRISPDPGRHAQPWMLELFPAGKHRHRKIRVGETPDRDAPELRELVQLPIDGRPAIGTKVPVRIEPAVCASGIDLTRTFKPHVCLQKIR